MSNLAAVGTVIGWNRYWIVTKQLKRKNLQKKEGVFIIVYKKIKCQRKNL